MKEKKQPPQPSSDIPLIVTTLHKGVFFGYGQDTDNKLIRLKNCRMVVYWSSDVGGGIIGLAANGPTSSCKITVAAPELTIQDVTSIMKCSPKAEEKWKLLN